MKKSGKAPLTKNPTQKKSPKRRVASYIGGELLDWMMLEVVRLESNESHFIRTALKEKKQRECFTSI